MKEHDERPVAGFRDSNDQPEVQTAIRARDEAGTKRVWCEVGEQIWNEDRRLGDVTWVYGYDQHEQTWLVASHEALFVVKREGRDLELWQTLEPCASGEAERDRRAEKWMSDKTDNKRLTRVSRQRIKERENQYDRELAAVAAVQKCIETSAHGPHGEVWFRLVAVSRDLQRLAEVVAKLDTFNGTDQDLMDTADLYVAKAVNYFATRAWPVAPLERE